MKQRIFIVGAGGLGSALGRGWLTAGHAVRFGVPDPAHEKYGALPRDLVGRADERGDAEIVVLATPFRAARAALDELGDLGGTTVIDCTNPVGVGPRGLELLFGHDTSGAEQIAASSPGAHVFKTLNQTGVENVGGAGAFERKPVMFVAGDDAARKTVVMQLVADLHFESVDAGPLAAARLLEPLAMLWIELAMRRGHGRDFAFALLPRPNA